MNEHRTPARAAGYQEDFYAWTQHQAKLLRSLEGLGAKLPAEIDLPHLAEEVEDLGKAELRGATSLIRNIMVHVIKAASDPDAEAVGHWREETATFHADLSGFYAPSMSRLIDMQKLWSRARYLAEIALEGRGRSLSPQVPLECPYSLQDVVSERFRFEDALAKLGKSPLGG